MQGIVVTHGTDTLEETAYLLDRTLDGDTPVVCTGAMRTSDDPEWDGARNLTDAIRVAAAVASRGRGTQVVFNGRIWQGREAVKVNTVALDAFGAPFGAQRGSVRWREHESRDTASGPRGFLRRGGHAHRAGATAELARAWRWSRWSIGDRGQLLDAARGAHDGVVVEAFGSGNLPPGAVPAIGRWLDEGKPVVLSSRCAAGLVSPVYAFDGGGARTVAMGAIPAGPRTPVAGAMGTHHRPVGWRALRLGVAGMKAITIPEEVHRHRPDARATPASRRGAWAAPCATRCSAIRTWTTTSRPRRGPKK